MSNFAVETLMNIGPAIDLALTFGFLALMSFAASMLAKRIELVPAVLSQNQRAASLDGLRGYLALCVIMHHAAIHQQFWRTGIWEEPASLVFAWLGPAPVALFFMLTGFLFWSKAIQGRRAEAVKLWVGRVRRIVPMFLFAGLITFSMAAALQGGLIEPVEKWMSDLGSVATGGILEFPQRLNQLHSVPLNAGVTWTLRYEWYFYLALPVLALYATPKSTGVLTILCACLASTHTEIGIACFNFSLGMSAAVIRAHWSVPNWVKRLPGFLLCIGCVALLSLGSGHQTMWSSLALGVVFVTVACGQDFCGLLVSQPARWLGVVSYSVYLLHGIVLYMVVRQVSAFTQVESLPLMTYWALISGVGLLTVVMSTVTYCLIERPFIQSRPATVPVAV